MEWPVEAQDLDFWTELVAAALAAAAHLHRRPADPFRRAGLPADPRLLDDSPWAPDPFIRVRNGAPVAAAVRRMVGAQAAQMIGS
jgi:hypothetical protein